MDDKANEQFEADKAECTVLYNKIKSKTTQGASYLLDTFLDDYELGCLWQVTNEHQEAKLKRRILELINYVATDNMHSMLVAEGRVKA